MSYDPGRDSGGGGSFATAADDINTATAHGGGGNNNDGGGSGASRQTHARKSAPRGKRYNIKLAVELRARFREPYADFINLMLDALPANSSVAAGEVGDLLAAAASKAPKGFGWIVWLPLPIRDKFLERKAVFWPKATHTEFVEFLLLNREAQSKPRALHAVPAPALVPAYQPIPLALPVVPEEPRFDMEQVYNAAPKAPVTGYDATGFTSTKLSYRPAEFNESIPVAIPVAQPVAAPWMPSSPAPHQATARSSPSPSSFANNDDKMSKAMSDFFGYSNQPMFPQQMAAMPPYPAVSAYSAIPWPTYDAVPVAANETWSEKPYDGVVEAEKTDAATLAHLAEVYSASRLDGTVGYAPFAAVPAISSIIAPAVPPRPSSVSSTPGSVGAGRSPELGSRTFENISSSPVRTTSPFMKEKTPMEAFASPRRSPGRSFTPSIADPVIPSTAVSPPYGLSILSNTASPYFSGNVMAEFPTIDEFLMSEKSGRGSPASPPVFPVYGALPVAEPVTAPTNEPSENFAEVYAPAGIFAAEVIDASMEPTTTDVMDWTKLATNVPVGDFSNPQLFLDLDPAAWLDRQKELDLHKPESPTLENFSDGRKTMSPSPAYPTKAPVLGLSPPECKTAQELLAQFMFDDPSAADAMKPDNVLQDLFSLSGSPPPGIVSLFTPIGALLEQSAVLRPPPSPSLSPKTPLLSSSLSSSPQLSPGIDHPWQLSPPSELLSLDPLIVSTGPGAFFGTCGWDGLYAGTVNAASADNVMRIVENAAHDRGGRSGTAPGRGRGGRGGGASGVGAGGGGGMSTGGSHRFEAGSGGGGPGGGRGGHAFGDGRTRTYLDEIDVARINASGLDGRSGWGLSGDSSIRPPRNSLYAPQLRSNEGFFGYAGGGGGTVFAFGAGDFVDLGNRSVLVARRREQESRNRGAPPYSIEDSRIARRRRDLM
ncbi:hypothetical protein DFJ73DRAFT_830033 [Zopfochytrium polystomum]|nr:hypothetical protein DFJ73DRAFT_830033 [Zopfochytrium polystomum]